MKHTLSKEEKIEAIGYWVGTGILLVSLLAGNL